MTIARIPFSASPRYAAIVLAAVGIVHAVPAEAGRKTGETQVTLEVRSSCQVSNGDMNFGTPIKGINSMMTSTSITVNCTAGTPYRVWLDEGAHYDGKSRRMYGGQANGKVFYANYSLYKDPLRLIPWGVTAADGVSRTMGGSRRQVIPVYGLAQIWNLRASEYIDTVTVVLEY